MPPAPLLADLPTGFRALTLETAGSPAPWSTAPPEAPLQPQILVAALVTLARALNESGEQSQILASALDRAQQAHDEQRRVVARAKDAVLHASRAAQVAHGEARRFEKLNGVFRQGADRAVASLDRKILRLVRGGKRAHEALSEAGRRQGGDNGEDPLSPYGFVEELVVDLDLDEVDVVKGSIAAGDALDDEWQAIEDDLVATLAVRVMDKASPRLTGTFHMPQLDSGVGETLPGRAVSLPPTPPGSVHSSDLGEADDGADEDDDPDPDEDTLALLLRPVVHPVIALLFHLHHLLGKRLTAAVDAFESLVRASSAAVDTHRLAAQRLARCAGKLRDLRVLESREREEVERTMDELRDTVVELARWRKGIHTDDG